MDHHPDLAGARARCHGDPSNIGIRQGGVDLLPRGDREADVVNETGEGDAKLGRDPPEPGGQQLARERAGGVWQRRRDGGRRQPHAKAGVALASGRQASMLVSLMHSVPEVIASIARSLNMAKIRAVTPSVTCRTCRNARTEYLAGKLQRQMPQDGDDQSLEVFIPLPPNEPEFLEPARQLHVAADRLACLCDPQAHERDLQLIAQVAERVEQRHPFPRSLPVRERGSKLAGDGGAVGGVVSLPVRERGSKPGHRTGQRGLDASLPVRERGSKRGAPRGRDTRGRRSPCGARIETMQVTTSPLPARVAPRAGARIETSAGDRSNAPRTSLPVRSADRNDRDQYRAFNGA